MVALPYLGFGRLILVDLLSGFGASTLAGSPSSVDLLIYQFESSLPHYHFLPSELN